MDCFRIHSNERFSCRFHFLVQALLVLLVSFFCSVILFFFFFLNIRNVLVIFSRFALRIHNTTSFALCIFLLIISHYWTNVINLPNVVSISWLYLFILNDSFLCQINGCENERSWIQWILWRSIKEHFQKAHRRRRVNNRVVIKRAVIIWQATSKVRTTFKLIYFVV